MLKQVGAYKGPKGLSGVRYFIFGMERTERSVEGNGGGGGLSISHDEQNLFLACIITTVKEETISHLPARSANQKKKRSGLQRGEIKEQIWRKEEV